VSDDIIDYDGDAKSLGEQRDYAFQVMKQTMIAKYSKSIAHVAPMVKMAKLDAYAKGVQDSWAVFSQIVEKPSDEELSAG